MGTTSNSKLIKYHNDLNKIKLPSFTEQEQNLLMGIISKIKDRPVDSTIKFTPRELAEFTTKNYTNKELGNILRILKEKFFKADFTILIEKDDMVGKETINLFQTFILWYSKDDLEYKNLLHVEMQVNPYFHYLVNNITDHFTKFSFLEFKEINGKYTKTLYRLLKQYKRTGFMHKKWEDFVDVMDFPKSLTMSDIDKILKSSIKELSEPKNLFNQDWISFRNLTYEKEKGKGRGRGGSVIGIKFNFVAESGYEQEDIHDEEIIDIELINKPTSPAIPIPVILRPETYIGVSIALMDLKTQRYNFLKIQNIFQNNDNQIVVELLNVDDNHKNSMYFESIKHLENFIRKNKR
ncbi:putative RepE [Campylobacter hyointestinalis subsp. hyointestinalis]|uniref:RepE n=1 Tax=Campylobacter hyointestinalis subsp. hyointestinalis TaxID=91352 RepID=A0A0S4SY01_CAMHY|nr:replication initiation protein [Campylobacter hyointestinalis]CUU90698.1 putative RepE [Campylobacter hyointestinalis subsp. hyointestinalis]